MEVRKSHVNSACFRQLPADYHLVNCVFLQRGKRLKGEVEVLFVLNRAVYDAASLQGHIPPVYPQITGKILVGGRKKVVLAL